MAGTHDPIAAVDSAFWTIGGICIALLLGITVAMVLFTVRFRRSRRPVVVQTSGNLPLEIVWLTVPTLIVLYMFVVGYRGFRQLTTSSPGARVVEVLAQKWNWSFRYPDEDLRVGELTLPVGHPVRFELTSKDGDVLHSFYLPAFRVKEDCVPGMKTSLEIHPLVTGNFNIFCSELCGEGHAQMRSLLHVVTEAEFRAWVEQERDRALEPIDIAEALDPTSKKIKEREGEKLFLTYCASCHGREGKGGGEYQARDFTTLRGWSMGVTLTDIFRTISEGIPGTAMRSHPQLLPWDRFALAHRVAAFYPAKDRPVPTAEEIAALVKDYRLDRQTPKTTPIPIERAMREVIEEAGKRRGGTP